MPDGAVKRVKATATDTVDGIMAKLGMDGGGGAGGGEGLSTDASGSVAAGSASVAALGLGNGDFLFVQVLLVLQENCLSVLFIPRLSVVFASLTLCVFGYSRHKHIAVETGTCLSPAAAAISGYV